MFWGFSSSLCSSVSQKKALAKPKGGTTAAGPLIPLQERHPVHPCKAPCAPCATEMGPAQPLLPHLLTDKKKKKKTEIKQPALPQQSSPGAVWGAVCPCCQHPSGRSCFGTRGSHGLGSTGAALGVPPVPRSHPSPSRARGNKGQRLTTCLGLPLMSSK